MGLLGCKYNNRKVKNTLFAAVWLSRFKGAKYVEAHLPGEKDIMWYVRVLHFIVKNDQI